ncbi:hypothetical protein D6C92_04571 [Aureobasidium pullulans]|nr:hypothetical protein D6C92_04571 [Aureobasidium pullulans]TIA22873.1 hypothetical protein D6C81_03168 [Aureobasidium pullulans]
MTSNYQKIIAIMALIGVVNAQYPPFSLCTAGGCDDCPQTVTSGGTGYPQCVVYDSATVFASGNLAAAETGGYTIFFDIAQPNEGCTTIVKSPADTQVQACGTTIGTFKNAACTSLNIKETFMVQFCCGQGDCAAAGVSAPPGDKRDLVYRVPSAEAGGLSAAMLMYQNGTIIPPAKAGPMPASSRLDRRDDCSYTADGQAYTRPADNTQLVTKKSLTGPADVEISTSRTQEWSTSISAGVNILEIVSSSVSFEFSESVTDSTSFTFPIPSGQTGRVGFTANLRCTKGTISCSDGSSYYGETCSPIKTDGELDGTYAVIVST